MSNLEKVTTVDKLPLGLKKFAELRVNETPNRNLAINFKKQQCYDIITRVHMACGTKGNDSDVLVFQTNELLSCLTDKYGELTIREIERAFEMLIAGEFGPFMGLFKKSYYQALKSYYELPQRTESMKAYLALLDAPKVSDKPIALKLKETAKSCLESFLEYKESGTMPFVSFAFYDFLWKDLGLIKWTNEQKTEIKQQATKEYTGYLQAKKAQRLLKHEDYILAINNLLTNPSYVNVIKKISLKRYCDYCLQGNFDLETELKKRLQVEV